MNQVDDIKADLTDIKARQRDIQQQHERSKTLVRGKEMQRHREEMQVGVGSGVTQPQQAQAGAAAAAAAASGMLTPSYERKQESKKGLLINMWLPCAALCTLAGDHQWGQCPGPAGQGQD